MDAQLAALLEQLTGQQRDSAQSNFSAKENSTKPGQEVEPKPTKTVSSQPKKKENLNSCLQIPSAALHRSEFNLLHQPLAPQTLTQQIKPNPLFPQLDPKRVETLHQRQLHEDLLRKLELGRIHPEEMARFRSATNDAKVEQMLMWVLFHITQLEKHRQNLVQHLGTTCSPATDPAPPQP